MSMNDGHGHHHGPTTFLTKYVFSTDHKVIGVQFMFTALLFVILGGLLALGVRYQLAWPNQHVPYAQILPRKMTNRAPETNLALWKLGCQAQLISPLTADGQTLPATTRVRLDRFPQGLAVTIPTGTLVRSEGGQTRVLDEPMAAFVDRGQVMADYDYKRQVPEVRAVKHTQVILPSTDDKPQRRLALLGVERWVVDGSGRPVSQTVDGPITLAIRTNDTPVSITVKPQQVIDHSGAQIARIERSISVASVSSSQIRFYKEALTTDAYLQLFTMHASIMIFFVIIPMLVGGFGNFLIPLMIGARDMAFPKLNMLSYWLAAPAGAVMLASFWTTGGAAGGGWTMYPPLAGSAFTPQLGTTLWIGSVGLVGFSSVVGAINYITTIINMRAPGMTMFRMPLTVWSLLITSALALFATPVLTAAMVLLLLDRTLGTLFFIPAAGGQPLMWQHLFWFYSHPAVYIMILPAMGVTSDILACYARKPIFGYKPMIYAMAAITGLGFIVWGHHMFQSGMNPVMGTTFMASTIMIAVPSAIKTFNWLGTLWGGNIRFTPAMLNALGFVSMFVIGGLSGIFMASAPVDIPIHDTYFIVAHIHYVLFGGSLFGIFAGIYHWFPKMFGRQLDQRWGTIHFVMTIVAFNGTFFLMHILGIGGHPRRYASIMEYPTLQHLQPLNVFMTICAMMLGMAQIPFFYNVFMSLPRKLGRGVAAVFVVLLGLPTIIGQTYWGGFTVTDDSGLLTRLAHLAWGHHLQQGPDQFYFSDAQRWVGYGLLMVLLVKIALYGLWQLPRGGRIATVVCGLPVVAFVIYLFKLGTSGALFDPQNEATMVTWRVWHDIAVSVGLSAIYISATVLLVFVLWAVGGALRLAPRLGWLLHVLWFPLFMAPLVLKHDPYLWIGQPGGFAYRWLLLGLLALPGLVYLVVIRPKDRFGDDPGTNPWDANSLEWTTSSPPPHLNFEKIPTVYRGPYEYNSPVVEEDYLSQVHLLPTGVVEPAGH